jgi:hypothetical protein
MFIEACLFARPFCESETEAVSLSQKKAIHLSLVYKHRAPNGARRPVLMTTDLVNRFECNGD